MPRSFGYEYVLFFSSNRLGGYGGFDIWYSEINNKEFKKPKNIGSLINTHGDEVTPFYDKKENIDVVDDMRMPLDKSNPHISFVNYVKKLQEVLNNYTLKYDDSQRLPEYQLEQHTNLQKYEPGQGYKVWHFEDGGEIINTTLGNARRLLVFMTYLNDVKSDNGNTYFPHFDLKIKPEKGKTLIWPAEWTHAHAGEILKD